jgi:DNA-binding transcriptional MerR regulator
MTTAEVARAIGVARSTLAAYARKGWLQPAFRLPSGQLRWRLSDVEQQLSEIDIKDWPGRPSAEDE